MNKKILIASLFATLMLMVPMTSVVGVSDTEGDCGCKVVNSSDLFRVKLLMVRLKVVTNILLLRFGHITEIREKCEEILENLDLNKLSDDPFICDILWLIIAPLSKLWIELLELSWEYQYKDPELYNYYLRLATLVQFAMVPFATLSLIYDCDWVPIHFN